jgi:hypothetical protein
VGPLSGRAQAAARRVGVKRSVAEVYGEPVVRVASVMDQMGTSTRPVMVMDSQGNGYWMKGRWRIEHPHAPFVQRSLVTEQLVGRIGELLEAPVCDVCVGHLDASLCSGPAEHLLPGRVHLSRQLSRARDSYACADDAVNRPRFAAYAVLFGLLNGNDRQFLSDEPHATCLQRRPRAVATRRLEVDAAVPCRGAVGGGEAVRVGYDRSAPRCRRF